jgi:hypothetical protein
MVRAPDPLSEDKIRRALRAAEVAHGWRAGWLAGSESYFLEAIPELIAIRTRADPPKRGVWQCGFRQWVQEFYDSTNEDAHYVLRRPFKEITGIARVVDRVLEHLSADQIEPFP